MNRLTAIILLLPLLLTTAVGCRWIYDGEPAQPQVKVTANYECLWMVPDTGCPLSQQQIDEATGEFPAELIPPLPQGLRTVVFRPTEQPLLFNLPPQGGTLPLGFGEYNLLFYNNALRTVAIEGLDQGKDAAIAVVGSGREPDVVFRAVADSLNVPCGIVNLTPTLRPTVWSYIVKFHAVAGMEYVASASCRISGMSAGVRLWNGENLLDTVFASCTLDLHKSAPIDSVGTMTGIVRSFGRPGFPGKALPDSCRQMATLIVKLTDGRKAFYPFDCTASISAQPQGGILEIDNVKINPDDADEEISSGGFDVNVPSWGSPIDIPVSW